MEDLSMFQRPRSVALEYEKPGTYGTVLIYPLDRLVECGSAGYVQPSILRISGVRRDTQYLDPRPSTHFYQFLSNLSKSTHALTRWENDPSPVLEGREDALNEEDVESLHENLEEVEEGNEVRVAEDVDQKVEDNCKEPKGMEIIHSASSKVTPSKLPSELQFEWVNLPNLNFIGPQHYALLETNDQLGALYGVLNKKGKESLELNASKPITCGKSEFKAHSEHLHKLHNNRAKVGTLSMKKHLGPWQLQEKLVDSHRKGWRNHVWDPGKSFKNHNFWRVITCVGAFRDLLSMNWDPLEPTKFKHWWGFKDEFKHKPP
ncbi:hypothetical protein PIB30_043333 [Stylosanthes scabra]|uniref:Uncharacterized protein n=1 Tax=Stylosanthes scabra TaxID=79078 RepID=A0ABU6THA8_9FABA|nr:hypothetical protein [Stylosanthes scabra]